VLVKGQRRLDKPMDRVKRSPRSKRSAFALWPRDGRATGSNGPCRSAYQEGRIWRHGSQPRRPWGTLFRSLTCDIDPRATSLSPSEALSLGHMRVQVLAILENGASKILPKGSDTLRILLILPNQQAAPKSY